MTKHRCLASTVFLVGLLAGADPAGAAWPVIDVSAIAQLASQLRMMQNHLLTARDQLTEAHSTLESLTGTRGMELVLGDVERNYLPGDWTALSQALTRTGNQYGVLAATVQELVTSSAVLTPDTLNGLTAVQRELIESGRRNAAGLAAIARVALATTSDRFGSLQQLIQSIGTATDPKAIYDLQARVQAENVMLQNEATKLQTLYQSQHADAALRTQRIREQGIADVGNLRTRPAMGL